MKTQKPIKLNSALALPSSGTVQSNSIVVLGLSRLSISVNVLSGSTAAGTFKVVGRTSYSGNDLAGIAKQDPQAVGPAGEWQVLQNMTGAAPAAGGSLLFDIPQTGITEIAVLYAATSGTGTADIWIAGKEAA